MFAWFVSAALFGMTLAPQAPRPQPAPAPQWNIGAIESYIMGRRTAGVTVYILYMTNEAGGPLASFECAQGNIFSSVALPGVDPIADMENQWDRNPGQRRVSWTAGDGEWSRREGWAWIDPGYYRPVDFETKMAMWTAAKAETPFSIREDGEALTVHWPRHDAVMDQFIEVCGWAED